MIFSVNNELVFLVDSFQDSPDKLKYRHYSMSIDLYARGKYSVIIHYPQVFQQDDLFALLEFVRRNRLSCVLGSNGDIFIQ